MPTTTFWTNHRGELCKTVRKGVDPRSCEHTGAQQRRLLQQRYASRCGGIYCCGGCWKRIYPNGEEKKIYLDGFPSVIFMWYVIECADQKGKDYVIPIEDLQSVFDAAAEATTPEGILRRMEEQLKLEAEKEKKRELEREENLRRSREEYDQRMKAKEAEEEAWWQENLSKLMDFLDF
jgi:hypothetical protein